MYYISSMFHFFKVARSETSLLF